MPGSDLDARWTALKARLNQALPPKTGSWGIVRNRRRSAIDADTVGQRTQNLKSYTEVLMEHLPFDFETYRFFRPGAESMTEEEFEECLTVSVDEAGHAIGVAVDAEAGAGVGSLLDHAAAEAYEEFDIRSCTAS